MENIPSPKGWCVLNYMKDKMDGKDIYIEDYENILDEMNQDYLNRTTNKYKKKYPNYKIVKAKVLSEDKLIGLHEGDIVDVYNKPFRSGILINDKYYFEYFIGSKFYYLANEYEGEIMSPCQIKILNN